MKVLYTNNISKSFGNFWALRNINIEIPSQSIFGLLGPNGAGKTTLIRIITQIIFADTGQVYFEGKPIRSEDVRRMGYLPEERGLYKKMKVGEHLEYLARLKGLSRNDALQKIRRWLEKFEIAEWTSKKVEDLSKGMQQKIQFIATIIHDPRLIILDEPFSGFDPINVNLIKDEIMELKKNGATIIFSTHRMESVEELCDHIALIHKSKVILNGSKKEIKQNHRSNTFITEHLKELEALPQNYQVLDQQPLEDGLYRSVIKLDDNLTPNALLSELLTKVEVRSFIEQIPSMNDIFITKVKDQGYA